MDERIVVLPFCTNQEIVIRNKMRIICLTDSPYVFNKYRTIPQELLDRVEDEIGLSEVEGKDGFECSLSLECNGVIVASSHKYRDEINNRIITQYKRNLFFRALCEEHGYDGCPISMHIHLSYTEFALRLIDKYVDLLLNRSTYKNTQLRKATTFKAKIEALKEAFSVDNLSNIRFIGDTKSDIVSDLVFDFAKLKGLINGVYNDDIWSIAQTNVELVPYANNSASSYDVLSSFVQEQLKAMLFGFTVYVDSNGVANNNIVSFESGKIFYDTENNCLYRG